jgi:hypothetical protein
MLLCYIHKPHLISSFFAGVFIRVPFKGLLFVAFFDFFAGGVYPQFEHLIIALLWHLRKQMDSVFSA